MGKANQGQRHELILAPSLLAGDHAALAESAQLIQDTGLKWAHLDIMDGHFVDNLTFGPETLAALRRRVPDLFYDVHLMLDEPHKYIDAFAESGAGLISIHVEPEYDQVEALRHIRELGLKNGIVINPATDWRQAQHLLDGVDLVLVMTVHPGRGGQPFREEMLPKIAALDEWRQRKGLNYRIEVDGGIDLSTWKRCRDSGADTFVSGSAFFKADDKRRFAQNFFE